jgi:hypothetical protein
LRDNFRREYKKLLKQRSANKLAVSNWVHYNELRFLENILEKKKLLSYCGSSNNDPQKDNDDIETIVIEPSEDDDDDNYSYIRQQQQQRIWQSSQQIMTRCCPHEPGDEFINFFKSITPYLAMMNPSAKLRVRIAIQEIILSELTRKIDATRRKMFNDCEVSSTPKKRVSNRVVKRNRKYI